MTAHIETPLPCAAGAGAGALRGLLHNRYLPQPFGLARGVVLPVTGGLRTAMGLYEIEIARYFLRLIEKSSICYDIGAANGFYSFAMAKRVPEGHVYSFECDPSTHARLKLGLARNPTLAARVTAVPLAVTAKARPGATTIDDFVTERGSAAAPTLMKLDVEGMEHDVLLGARRAIAAYRPRFIIETHGFEVEAACLNLLAQERYAYVIVNAQKIWPELRPTEVNRWVVAVHRDDPRASAIPH